MEKLSKEETEKFVKKSISSLDPDAKRNDISKSVRVKPYGELIGTYHINSRNPLIWLAKKPLSLCVHVFRIICRGYLEQRTKVDAFLSEGVHNIEYRLDDIESISEVEGRVTASINLILDQKLQETHVLIDKFKKELNYELVELRNYVQPSTNKEVEFKTKIINPDRVKALEKINIGAGMDLRNDYINIDHRALEGIDVVADVLDMPFEENTLQEIFASHVIEHFVQRDLEKILVYWFSLLRKGGVLRLITPNIEDMAKKYATGEVTWDELRSVALGGQDYASDYHFNHFSIQSIEELIHTIIPESKFSIVSASRRNGACFEMEVLVIK